MDWFLSVWLYFRKLKQLDDLSLKAYDDQCTGTNPRYPLISEIKDLYLAAYYGK